MKLRDFGIQDGISEVIATTISPTGKPNAAPIGIISDKKICARIYPDTHTYSNIQATKKLVANVVSDPLVFVLSALGDLDEKELYIVDEIPVLRCADAWVSFECEKDEQDDTLIYLHPIKGKVLRKRIWTIRRSTNAIIEATIHATRYLATKDEKYLKWIAHYEEIVKKCGSMREKEAMKKLKGFLRGRYKKL
ncbi:MAG: DUF447 family protein [Methanocellales archaeon]|nr:DUF447 family protein [Methanocellales archaeon]